MTISIQARRSLARAIGNDNAMEICNQIDHLTEAADCLPPTIPPEPEPAPEPEAAQFEV